MDSPRPSVLGRVDRVLAPLTWLAAALVVLLLLVGPELVGAGKPGPAATTAADGAAVFDSAGCGGCHTLAAAGSTGASGPDLDAAAPDAARVEAIVTAGSGAMPSFEGRLSAEEIRAVAAFVAGEDAAPGDEAEPATETIAAGDGPDGITVDEDGTVWVADARAGTLVSVPDGEPVPVGRAPDSPVPVAGAVWLVASGDDTAVHVEGREVTTIPVGREPSALAVAGGSAWVANAGDGTVTRIDLASREVAGEPIPVGARPLDLAAADGTVWVASADGVTRIDAATGRVTGDPIPLGPRPRAVAAGDGSVWVTDTREDTVTRIDAATGQVTGRPVPVGDDPRDVAVGEGSVWVAGAADDTVIRIDPATGQPAGDPIPVGDDPIGIAAGGGAVWTADFRAGTVTRIEP